MRDPKCLGVSVGANLGGSDGEKAGGVATGRRALRGGPCMPFAYARSRSWRLATCFGARRDLVVYGRPTPGKKALKICAPCGQGGAPATRVSLRRSDRPLYCQIRSRTRAGPNVIFALGRRRGTERAGHEPKIIHAGHHRRACATAWFFVGTERGGAPIDDRGVHRDISPIKSQARRLADPPTRTAIGRRPRGRAVRMIAW